MTTRLRDDFEQAKTLHSNCRADAYLTILSSCQASNADDRMTVYNMLGNIGVFEARAIEAGFYTIQTNAAKERFAPSSPFNLPSVGGVTPMMTEEQATKAIEFLKRELSSEDKPTVFFYGPYDKGCAPD
jgi:hypothetical protein